MRNIIFYEIHKTLVVIFVVVCVLVFGGAYSYAQSGASSQAKNTENSVDLAGAQDVKIRPENISSLFFTYWQHRAIIDSKNSRGVVRPPTQAELDAMERGDEFAPDPGPRDIILGGIVYSAEDDWTIWINELRVTPDAVPKEVLDLRVFKDYIEIKWLDEHTNQIIPLRMRAHQRFNINSRIFLPG